MPILDISAMLDTKRDPDARDRALARIGCFDDTKKRGRQDDYRRVLGWFVELPRKNLKNLATTNPAKLRELYDEARALQEKGSGDVIQYQFEADTAAQLPKIQIKVAEYLERLTTTGRIEFEAFKLCSSIELPRFRPGSKLPYSILVGEHVDPLHGKGLLYLFFLALQYAGDRLRECPQCATLFVQARRKQQVCSSRCRMRASRARRRKEREAKKIQWARDAQPKRSHAKHKKGGSHGAKKR